MSTVFSIRLSLDDISAIQRGEGIEQVLQTLSLAQTTPARVITNIAGGIMDQVNMLPYAVLPKACNVSAPTYNREVPLQRPFDMQGSGSAGVLIQKQHTIPAFTVPPPAMTDPFWADTKPSTPRSPTPENPTITVHIRGPLGTTPMEANMRDSFESVAKRYASLVEIPISDITFTQRFGQRVLFYQDNFGDWPHTLLTLGITDDTRLTASVTEITVTIRDLMLKEQALTLEMTSSFETLATVYAENDGAWTPDQLTFNISNDKLGTFDIDMKATPFLWEKSLYALGIWDGDVVVARPKLDTSYLIKFTVRDAMNRDQTVELKSTAIVEELGSKYQALTGLNVGALQFELDGFVLGRSLGHITSTIEQAGIYQNAIVTVKPQKSAKQDLAFQDLVFWGSTMSGRPRIPSTPKAKSSCGGGWGGKSVATGYTQSKAGSDFGASNHGGWY
ncbi:hypothetical protein LTR17_006305 [Elasticomyces elasticus]|nr:hypothetical protein LTR17_006305 [Elasticomyces elasticus]